MKLLPATISILSTCLILASCSTSRQPSQIPGVPTSSESNTIKTASGGGLETTLDRYDQEKMSHALDKPLGKSSDWVNPRTGVNYVVTPTGKLTYNGNPYCRRYNIVASRGGAQNQSSGTACVSATDSSWQIIN